MKFEKIIIGAGLYGLYAALKCGEVGQNVVVLERDSALGDRIVTVNCFI